MPLKYNTLSEYELNGIMFRTIEAVNDKGQRVWVKPVPVNSQTSVIVANILDRPQDVRWAHKISHFEEIHPILGKQNPLPAMAAGSICVRAGAFKISKEPNSQVVLFPLDPLNQNNPVKRCELIGNMSNSSTIAGSIDATTWIGYATTTGIIYY